MKTLHSIGPFLPRITQIALCRLHHEYKCVYGFRIPANNPSTVEYLTENGRWEGAGHMRDWVNRMSEREYDTQEHRDHAKDWITV